MGFLRAAGAVARKDLRIEWRSREVTNAAFSFALVVLLLFSFAFDPSGEETRAMSGGLLWVVYSFAGVLALNRSFAREAANDCLDALVAAPAPPAAVFLGKALANAALLLLLEAACLPVFGIFYNVGWTVSPGWLALVLVLGTWGFTVVGTFFSALTVNLRIRELMLPLLVFPITVPALMASVQLTTALFAGEPIAAEMIWVQLLVAFDLIFTLLGMAMVEFVLVG